MGMTMHARVRAVLTGESPDRPPFIDRLELWHRGLSHTDALPPAYAHLALTDIHRQVGMGQQKFQSPYATRLRGVDMTVTFNGEPLHRESDPIFPRFPDVDGVTPPDRTGITHVSLKTVVGTVTIVYEMLEEMLATGARAYMAKHPITDAADYRVIAHILERAEFVPRFDEFGAVSTAIGDAGYAIPVLERIPFQQLLIDYFESTDFFYALHDHRADVERLMQILDERVGDIVVRVAELDEPYLQFGDNLDGTMTNPILFKRYALPQYQRYADIIHGRGQRMGSHTDGDLGPILDLLPECGLDVCESVATAPLVPYPFQKIWDAWKDGPIIWGGIPSPLLESRTPEDEMHSYVDNMLEIVGDRPIVFGISDMVLPNNEIERVRWIADAIERAR